MKTYGFLGLGAVAAAGFVLGALVMNLGSSTDANAAVNTSDKAAIEKVVKEYIAANGQELVASIQNAAQREKLEQMSKLISGDTPTKGPASAKVTIVEFSDYQCPFCDRVQPSLTELQAKYGDKIRWVFKNLPLEFHPEARPAAYAARAAYLQGKFWEYHQQLWAQQASLGDKTYVAIAQGLKLDMDKFNKDRASAEVKQKVDNDQAEAEAVGARGTPFFLINGQGVSGALPAAEFSKVIDAELKK